MHGFGSGNLLLPPTLPGLSRPWACHQSPEPSGGQEEGGVIFFSCLFSALFSHRVGWRESLSFQSTPDTRITSPVTIHPPSQRQVPGGATFSPVNGEALPSWKDHTPTSAPASSPSWREPSARKKETGLPPSSPLTHQETFNSNKVLNSQASFLSGKIQ